MRVSTVIPLVGLASLGIAAIVALRHESPFEFPYEELPPDDFASVVAPVGEAELAGRLVDAEGRAIANAFLGLRQRGRLLWTYTGLDGEFRLPEVDAGPVNVSVNSHEYPVAILETEAGGGPVELRLGARIGAPPILPDPDGVDLLGTIRVPGVRTGELGGYEVALLPTASPDEVGSGFPRRAATDADGRFKLADLATAEYRVLLLPPEARGGTWPDLLTVLDGRSVTYDHPPPDRPDATLDLESISGQIEGFVHDRRPELVAENRVEFVEGALILATPAGGGDADDPRFFGPVQSGKNGAYLLRHLPPGEYDVWLTAGVDRRQARVTVHPRASIDPDF